MWQEIVGNCSMCAKDILPKKRKIRRKYGCSKVEALVGIVGGWKFPKKLNRRILSHSV